MRVIAKGAREYDGDDLSLGILCIALSQGWSTTNRNETFMTVTGAWAMPALMLSCCCALAAESSYYAGAMGGIATLSADGRSVFATASTFISLYKPENGRLLKVFGGIHLTDFLSVQANHL